MMKQIRSFKGWLCLCLWVLTAVAAQADDGGKQPIKVLQLNVWQDATQVRGAFQAIVDEIAAHSPDVVTLCEVRDYRGTHFTDSLCRSLAGRGLCYYTCPSKDGGILSRYPIIESAGLDSVSINRAVIDVKGRRMAVFAVHLDYTHYACYLPRGYDGVTWKECPLPRTVEEILAQNDASRRPREIKKLIAQAEKDLEAGMCVIIGGDFNEPSWLDWQSDTKDLYDHRGFVVPWTTTRLLHEAGYADAYRVVHPSAVTHPGFTWVAGNKDKDISSLAWAPKSDERDRIDFIFYKGSGMEAVKAAVLGPRSSIVRGSRVDETSQDSIIEPQGVWPSDHKGVLVTLEYVQ